MELKKKRLEERTLLADYPTAAPLKLSTFVPKNIKLIDTPANSSVIKQQNSSGLSKLAKMLDEISSFQIDEFEVSGSKDDAVEQARVKQESGPILQNLAINEIGLDDALRMGVDIEANFDLQPLIDGFNPQIGNK
jgi:hypothetical protein